MAKITYDYSDKEKDAKRKEERLNAINDLIELMNEQKLVILLFIPNIDSIMDMIKKNIFRSLPNINKGSLDVCEAGEEEEEEKEPDPRWVHIRGIYQIFFNLINNEACDFGTLKQFITPNFISDFLQLFDSVLVEERDFLKIILHRIYAKLIPRRRMIRKAINDLFLSLLYEIHKFNGISELLQIMASIISGFGIPLREEHIIFFKNIIIPLHKLQISHLYFDDLQTCSKLFLEKERNLSIHLLEGILKYWPFANYLKEALFLQELSEILIFCDLDNIQPLVNKLFKRIVKCISENHLQVAEEAMCLFESESFISIIKRYKTISFDILVPSVNYLAENHWYPQLQNQFGAIKEYLKKIDPQAFNNALETVNQKNPDKNVRIPIAPEEGRKLNQKWKNYIKIAKKKNPGYFDTISAFADKNIIWDYNSVYRNIYNKEEEYLG